MRGKSFFLVFLLVSLINLSSLVFPQEGYVYVSVEISGRNVIFLGEKVSIYVAANATPVHLLIYAPNEEVVYDVWVEANSTAQFTPSEEVYGLYTVKASYGNFTAETWFWLQNLNGMAVAPPQTVWVWKGITYNLSTVFEAGKISTYLLTASYEGKSFSVEWLSEVFTKLKPTEVKLESNGECWHIETYSAKNKIDSWIMNTWFGVKIRVNGTLEKETTFKWNFKNVYGNIFWQLDSFRLPCDTANLVYDFTDMSSRSYGCNYTVDKTNLKLDVYLQPNFDVDPTIFQDGFESGDFSCWSGTFVSDGAAAGIVTNVYHHGSKSARFRYDGSAAESYTYCYKTFSGYSELYTRIYWRTSALPSAGCVMQPISECAGSGSEILKVQVYNNGSSKVWRLTFLNGTSWTTLTSSSTVNINQWYCVEVRLKIGNGDGVATLYIDGSSLLSQSNLDNDYYGSTITEVRVGQTYCDDGTLSYNVYSDCVVVADTYIGPEGGQYSRQAAQSASFSFVAARTAALQRTATQNLGTTFISQPLSLLGRVGQQLMGFTFTSQPTLNSVRSAEQLIALSLFAEKIGIFSRSAQQSISTFFSVDRIGNFIRAAAASLSFAFSALAEKLQGLIREAALSVSLISSASKMGMFERAGSFYGFFTFYSGRLPNYVRNVGLSLSAMLQGLGRLSIVRDAGIVFSFASDIQKSLTAFRMGSLGLNFQNAALRLSELFREASQSISLAFSGLGYIPSLNEVFASLTIQLYPSSSGFWVNPYYASKTLVFAVGGFAFIMAIVALAISAKRWREKKEETEEED